MRKQPFAAGFADALAPAHQAGRIARQLVAEVLLAAEVLPVRVLDPALDHFLVAQRVGVLQVQQRGHQARRQRRPARGRRELRAPLGTERLPVDQLGQPHQFVTLVDQVHQFRSEQVVVGRLLWWLRAHRAPAAVCKESISIRPVPCNLHHRHPPSQHASMRVAGVVQGRLPSERALRPASKACAESQMQEAVSA